MTQWLEKDRVVGKSDKIPAFHSGLGSQEQARNEISNSQGVSSAKKKIKEQWCSHKKGGKNNKYKSGYTNFN